MNPTANQPVETYGIPEDFPRLYDRAKAFDFAERLGGTTPGSEDQEIDAVLRELLDARRALAEGSA